MRTLMLCFGMSILLAVPLLAEDSVKTESKPKPKADVMKNDSTKTTATDTTKVKEPEWITTESGLKYRDIVVGEGVEAKRGMKVDCHYTLWLLDEKGKKGKKVDSSHDRNSSFQCTLGVALIEGWSEGMTGMKEGGTRELIVPPKIGYGARGAGGVIPPNATLFFEIQFLKAL